MILKFSEEQLTLLELASYLAVYGFSGCFSNVHVYAVFCLSGLSDKTKERRVVGEDGEKGSKFQKLNMIMRQRSEVKLLFIFM